MIADEGEKKHRTCLAERFRGLGSFQTFLIDDLIEKLSCSRDLHLNLLFDKANAFKAAIDEGRIAPKYNGTLFNLKELNDECNAVYVLKKMKERGETKIELHTGKNMEFQILAMATRQDANHGAALNDDWQHSFDPEDYKRKLEMK